MAVVASPVYTLLTAALRPVVCAVSMFVIGNARSRVSSLMLSRCLIVLEPLSMYCYLQLTNRWDVGREKESASALQMTTTERVEHLSCVWLMLLQRTELRASGDVSTRSSSI
ncbi:hypothetical protein BKA80DRAFT_286247 [Phyllosticta citrichinensis]